MKYIFEDSYIQGLVKKLSTPRKSYSALNIRAKQSENLRPWYSSSPHQ